MKITEIILNYMQYLESYEYAKINYSDDIDIVKLDNEGNTSTVKIDHVKNRVYFNDDFILWRKEDLNIFKHYIRKMDICTNYLCFLEDYLDQKGKLYIDTFTFKLRYVIAYASDEMDYNIVGITSDNKRYFDCLGIEMAEIKDENIIRAFKERVARNEIFDNHEEYSDIAERIEKEKNPMILENEIIENTSKYFNKAIRRKILKLVDDETITLFKHIQQTKIEGNSNEH
jgi:hypothetical protein